MTVNAIFNNVKIYNVMDRLDIVDNETFVLEVLDAPADLEIFTNKDPILTLVGDFKVTTSELGESKIRFMSGTSVIKDLTISVVDHTAPIATALNLTLGEPVQK